MPFFTSPYMIHISKAFPDKKPADCQRDVNKHWATIKKEKDCETRAKTPLDPATRARPQRIAARRQRELMVVIAEQENAQSIDWLDESEVEFEGLLSSENAGGSDVLPKIPLSKLSDTDDFYQIASNSPNFLNVSNCCN